jgi:hypothetical protein
MDSVPSAVRLWNNTDAPYHLHIAFLLAESIPLRIISRIGAVFSKAPESPENLPFSVSAFSAGDKNYRLLKAEKTWNALGCVFQSPIEGQEP